MGSKAPLATSGAFMRRMAPPWTCEAPERRKRGGESRTLRERDSAATRSTPHAGQAAILSQRRSTQDLMQSHEEVSLSATYVYCDRGLGTCSSPGGGDLRGAQAWRWWQPW